MLLFSHYQRIIAISFSLVIPFYNRIYISLNYSLCLLYNDIGIFLYILLFYNVLFEYYIFLIFNFLLFFSVIYI